MRRPRNRFLPTRLQATAAFIVAVILLVLTDTFFLESVVVPTSSMEPTLLPNERLLLQKWPRREIRRFDVVVANAPALGKRVIKRVIGLPGDRIEVEEGWRVRVNGEPLAYAVTADTKIWKEGEHLVRVRRPQLETEFSNGISVTLGPDDYFLLGDSRLESADSRLIGAVHRSEIEGVAGVIWYSWDIPQHHLRWNRLLRACE